MRIPANFPMDVYRKLSENEKKNVAHDLAQNMVNDASVLCKSLSEVEDVHKFMLEFASKIIATVATSVVVNNVRESGKPLAVAIETVRLLGSDAGVNITAMAEDFVRQAYSGKAEEKPIHFKKEK